MKGRRIFITTGSQKFQFNRLLKEVDQLYEDGLLTMSAFAQIGSSDYRPKHYEYRDFLDRDAFAVEMDRADIVITHGGTGVIISAVKKGKKVIAVPRLAKYGEHVDDHQLQLLEQFEGMGIIEVCHETDNLADCLARVESAQYKTYVSNTAKIVKSIDEFLKEVKKK